MAKPKKLKSGNWNIRVYDGRDENGKPIQRSFTAPTKLEAEFLAIKFNREKGTRKTPKEDLTVRQAVERYIKSSAVLSPTTLQAYRKILDHAFPGIMDQKVSSLDDTAVQKAINEELKRPASRTGSPLSPKTVKNEWGLCSSALRSLGYTFNIRLPKTQHHIKEYPEPAEVISAIKGTNIELPCLLAMWLSFSLSEIRGINCSDIQKGYVTINRVRVDVDGDVKEKREAKVETRLRRHRVPDYIMDLIRKQDTFKDWQKSKKDGPLIPMTRNQIYHYWKRIGEQNGIDLSFHDLRHMNASIMLMLNVPEKYAMERGGWKTPHVMKATYQHTFSSERVKVDDMVDGFFNSIL